MTVLRHERVSNNIRKYRRFSRGGKLSGLESWFAELNPEAGLVFRCVVNMCIGGALAIYVRELYTRFGSTIMNREDFANVFPMLTLITVVIIYVVKSSLTLSLGLVGALSIVRFRTAIKSAEELTYLFLCIGIGLGLGADRRLLTIVAVIVIKKLGAEHVKLFLVPATNNIYARSSMTDLIEGCQLLGRDHRIMKAGMGGCENGDVFCCCEQTRSPLKRCHESVFPPVASESVVRPTRLPRIP